ncbi:hypothetical protein ABFS82_07G086700 [Erythranthe guttata]
MEFDSENFLKEFYIPSYMLNPQAKVECLPDIPECPVLVFINSRSGGQLGGDLLITYRTVLNKDQVKLVRPRLVGEEAPDSVLRRVFLNLEMLKNNGDEFVPKLEEKLKIVVAGGDGTAGWLLGVLSDLKLSRPPPVATVPLGTENNVPFAFGWGKRNPGTDRKSVMSFLERVRKAKPMSLDSWHILMRMRAPKGGSNCDPIAPLELPHSLHAFDRVSSTDDLNMEGYHTFRGGFWNYFSMGMDAQVSYAFHSERKLHLEKINKKLINQSTYAELGGTQGWFSPSLAHPSLSQLCKVKTMKIHGDWHYLDIPPNIRSIVCLNLPSFSGGLNPWGTPNNNSRRSYDLTPTFVDDGLIEVIGFKDAWHGLVLLARKGHGTRLAQARRIGFEFSKGAADHTYMAIDGEPWRQPLPSDNETVVVEISHFGRVKMLATYDCVSKSMFDPFLKEQMNSDNEEDESVGEESVGEEWRKFGAADSFKIPDISQLS